MSTAVKVMLIVIALILLAVFAIAGLGAYWWSQNGQRLVEGVQQARNEGLTFGRSTDNAGCLNEALSRHRAHHGFSDAISNNLFLNGCLETSRPTAGFCEGVPPSDEFGATVGWQMEQCREAGISDNYCGQLFQQVQQHCERRNASSTNK